MKLCSRGITLGMLVVSTVGLAEMTGTFPIIVGLGTGSTSEYVGRYYAESVSYVNGGITVTYPEGFFDVTPLVLVSIELTGRSYSTGQLVAGEIVSSSATSATVRVNLHNGTLISEVATGDVTVHLKAMAPEPVEE